MEKSKKIQCNLGGQLLFVNNIRWLLTIFVVLIHLNVTYSTFGKWYYTEMWQIDGLAVFFAMYGMLSQAYILGVFFFIAGYFTPESFDKKGIEGFIASRFIRLGIPTFAYMLVIHPLIIFILIMFNKFNSVEFFPWYMNYIKTFKFLSNSGPMWFTLVLLLFSIIYSLCRVLFPELKLTEKLNEKGKINIKIMLLLVIITTILAFLIRIVEPAGKSLFNNELGNFMQIGFFSSYIIFYIFGIIARRAKMIKKLSYKFSLICLILAIVIGIPLWFYTFIATGISRGSVECFGGLNWKALLYAFWESFFAVFMLMGLLGVFKEKFNKQGKVTKFLSDNSFGVYLFHPIILVLISLLMINFSIHPLFKMYTVALLVIPLTFTFSYFMKKIKFVKKFLSL